MLFRFVADVPLLHRRYSLAASPMLIRSIGDEVCLARRCSGFASQEPQDAVNVLEEVILGFHADDQPPIRGETHWFWRRLLALSQRLGLLESEAFDKGQQSLWGNRGLLAETKD
jgi:hypothetical protein